MIHLPERGLDGEADDGNASTPVKKKTRRGSRGGKNRRKKPAGATLATAEPETPADTEVPEARTPRQWRSRSQRSKSQTRPNQVASSEPSSSENGTTRTGVTRR